MTVHDASICVYVLGEAVLALQRSTIFLLTGPLYYVNPRTRRAIKKSGEPKSETKEGHFVIL